MTDSNTIARKEGGSDVTQYDPERGLQTVVTAEASEKHWLRATNTSSGVMVSSSAAVIANPKIKPASARL